MEKRDIRCIVCDNRYNNIFALRNHSIKRNHLQISSKNFEDAPPLPAEKSPHHSQSIAFEKHNYTRI